MANQFSGIYRARITDDVIHEWFETLDPSIRAHVTDFSLNTLRKYEFDFERISDHSDKEFCKILASHFMAFLKLRIHNDLG